MSKDNRKFILSDSASINSKGFRVDVNGLDLERFKANPVMFYEHDPKNVIGRWIEIEKEAEKLTARPEFDEADENALLVAGKVARGFLNGASIGLVVKELATIDGVDVVTRAELIEASIVSVPSDAGAVQLYNEKMECLSIDKIKLSMAKENKEDKTNFKEQYKQICDALGLNPYEDIETVLACVNRLMKPQFEDAVEKALKMGAIQASEKSFFIQLSRNSQSDVIDMLDIRMKECEKQERINTGKLYRENIDKIMLHLGADGWNNIRELGYEKAKKIVDNLSEKLTLREIYQGVRLNGSSGEKHDLDWYRKNNPQALQDDPELFERLKEEKRINN